MTTFRYKIRNIIIHLKVRAMKTSQVNESLIGKRVSISEGLYKGEGTFAENTSDADIIEEFKQYVEDNTEEEEDEEDED